MDFPNIALAVRQPWAWAIIYGGKNVENRSTFSYRYLSGRHGRICIVASKGMTKAEYSEGEEFMHSIGVTCPKAYELERGGIIGTVEIWGGTQAAKASKWFFGPSALALRDPQPSAFIPVEGQLGFWAWSRSTRTGPEPALKWMQAPIAVEPSLFNV